MTNLGFFLTSGSRTHVRFQFSTHAAAGANVAPSTAFEAADLRIYKATDGAAFSATQRSSANGITMTSPFDSLTGYHDVDIDLTDNTDASFYAAGCAYIVVLAPDETVDSQTLTGVPLAYFEIGVPTANVTQNAGTAITAASGIQEVKVASIAANAITATSINADAITAAKVADGTIDAATFAAGAITATVIADGAIDAATFAAGAINAAAIATDAIDADALATDAVTEIKNGVWGTTGLSALSRTTAGGILYSAGALSSTNSTVNDAGASTTVFVTALTSAVDDFYNDQTILFTDGALAGQSRIISNYDGTTKAITVDEALTSAPANGVAFTIYASHTHTTTSVGTAVWSSADRQLTALDEDVTTIDLNATTIGTVTTVTNKVTPIDVNGVTFANWAKWVGATTQGKCVVTLISGNDYTFDYYGMDDTTIVWTTTCTLGGRAAPTRS